ncbi:hypothetical protein F4679DRAFT_303192 [Xylaria curta]|nr:hypothetical protein F4679DRAFT_303192 [Xylaria curta]
MATTFHSFTNLPAELRVQIWVMTADPRILQVCANNKTSDPFPNSTNIDYTSPIPPPAVLQVCRESRLNAPYQKAFFTSTAVPGGTETKYIWVNFQQDMICLADHRVERLAPHHANIERLRFTVPTGDLGDRFYDYFYHNSREMLCSLSALRELHIAVEEYILIWGTTVECARYGECPRENVKFLDLKTGLLLTGPQLEMMYKWNLEDGGKVWDVDDFDDELGFMLDNETGLNLSELAEID